MNANDPTTAADANTSPRGADGPAAIVLSFIGTLAERFRAMRAASSGPGATDQLLASLLLADAAMRYAPGKRPLQLAVLGPTQTGKSTIVNLILGTHAAEVSPLAGFTVHPQGFWSGGDQHDQDWTAELFPGWQRREVAELSHAAEQLDYYILQQSPEAASPPPSPSPASLPPCVVWDTPDFDSLAAQSYQRGVLEVAALADAHVFVLSKEKYSDLSVWRMLQLLAPLGRPLIVCLNKLTPDAAEPIVASLRQQLSEAGAHVADSPVVTFGYEGEKGDKSNFGHAAERDRQVIQQKLDLSPFSPAVAELRESIAERLTATRANERASGVRAFVRRHWSDWTGPLEAELAALAQWQERVVAALDDAAESYRRDFLDHPQRFDTFRRATAELLHLLELPGLADALGQVRRVLSWPARRLFAARQAWALRRRKQGGVPHGLGSEEVVLYELIEKLLTTLERDAARRCDPAAPGYAVWRAIAQRLEQRSAHLRERFESAARAQREDFAPVVHATANRLYDELQKRPRMLNTLRAARVTTDLAGIALAIKTGGLGINDLLFAPAMFGLTSMLTEGALGSYMSRVSNDLKKQQLEHVRTRLIEGVFAAELRGVTADLGDADLFGISAERLRAAADALDAWERSNDE